jgi:hypothetical protein
LDGHNINGVSLRGDSMGTDKPIVLGKNTLVPLGVMLGVIITMVSVWGYLDSRFGAIMGSLDRQDRRLEQLERNSKDRWSSIDMRLWVSEFRRMNPEIKIPNLLNN